MESQFNYHGGVNNDLMYKEIFGEHKEERRNEIRQECAFSSRKAKRMKCDTSDDAHDRFEPRKQNDCMQTDIKKESSSAIFVSPQYSIMTRDCSNFHEGIDSTENGNTLKQQINFGKSSKGKEMYDFADAPRMSLVNRLMDNAIEERSIEDSVTKTIQMRCNNDKMDIEITTKEILQLINSPPTHNGYHENPEEIEEEVCNDIRNLTMEIQQLDQELELKLNYFHDDEINPEIPVFKHSPNKYKTPSPSPSGRMQNYSKDSHHSHNRGEGSFVCFSMKNKCSESFNEESRLNTLSCKSDDCSDLLSEPEDQTSNKQKENIIQYILSDPSVLKAPSKENKYSLSKKILKESNDSKFLKEDDHSDILANEETEVLIGIPKSSILMFDDCEEDDECGDEKICANYYQNEECMHTPTKKTQRQVKYDMKYGNSRVKAKCRLNQVSGQSESQCVPRSSSLTESILYAPCKHQRSSSMISKNRYKINFTKDLNNEVYYEPRNDVVNAEVYHQNSSRFSLDCGLSNCSSEEDDVYIIKKKTYNLRI